MVYSVQEATALRFVYFSTQWKAKATSLHDEFILLNVRVCFHSVQTNHIILSVPKRDLLSPAARCLSFCSGGCVAGGMHAGGMCGRGACLVGGRQRGACVKGDVHGRGYTLGEACVAGGLHGRGDMHDRGLCGGSVHG